jgi:hypothetical protein
MISAVNADPVATRQLLATAKPIDDTAPDHVSAAPGPGRKTSTAATMRRRPGVQRPACAVAAAQG